MDGERRRRARVGRCGGRARLYDGAAQRPRCRRHCDHKEYVFCLDAAGGKLLWKFGYPIKHTAGDGNAGRGPACTPAVEGDRVYTLGHGGELHCLDTDGKKKWSHTFTWGKMAETDYGFPQSPVLIGDFVVVNVGDHGTALDKRNGKVVWGDDQTCGACCSVVPVRQGVVAASWGGRQDQQVYVRGVDLSGNVKWTIRWRVNWGCLCSPPVVSGGKILLIGPVREGASGTARFSFGSNEADWVNSKTQSYTGQCVLLSNRVYGICDPGLLFCLDWNSGKEHWKKRGFDRKSALTAVPGKLIVQDGGGDLVIVEVPSGKELLRQKRVVGSTFTVPTYANGRLYCRDMAGNVACLRVGK